MDKTGNKNTVSPEELLKRARDAANRAYAPYSRFHVGAAMLFEGGEVVEGCNIENASYGLTMCAERCAVAVMISRGMTYPLAVAVVGSHEEQDDFFRVPCQPCGACRQILTEFNPDMQVILASDNGPQIFDLKELLPHSFFLER